MIGLGKTWRFTLRNGTGVDLGASALFVACRFVKFDVEGAQVFSADSTLTIGAVVNTAYVASATVDNSVDKWLGGDFTLVLVAPAGVNGRVDCFYERFVQGQWPTPGNGKLIAQITALAAGNLLLDFSI